MAFLVRLQEVGWVWVCESWFGYKMFPKGSRADFLIPNVMSTGGL